jgi:hypothetical protein
VEDFDQLLEIAGDTGEMRWIGGYGGGQRPLHPFVWQAGAIRQELLEILVTAAGLQARALGEFGDLQAQGSQQ